MGKETALQVYLGLYKGEREFELHRNYIVQIVKIPSGSASEEIREAWVGLSMLARKAEPSEIAGREHYKEGYIVSRAVGISSLEESGKNEAAEHFRNTWPFDKGFLFAKDELSVQQLTKGLLNKILSS